MTLTSKMINSENYKKYIDGIAETHDTAYDNNHLTSCFSLKKIKEYYSQLIVNSDISLLALDEGGSVIGFIISGENVSKGVGEFVKKNRFYLAMLLVSKPRFLIQKIIGRVQSYFIKSPPSNASFRLLSISVNSSKQSKGIGAFLITEFESMLVNRNFFEYGLSVRFINTRAVNFYIKHGFTLEKTSNGTAYMIKRLK